MGSVRLGSGAGTGGGGDDERRGVWYCVLVGSPGSEVLALGSGLLGTGECGCAESCGSRSVCAACVRWLEQCRARGSGACGGVVARVLAVALLENCAKSFNMISELRRVELSSCGGGAFSASPLSSCCQVLSAMVMFSGWFALECLRVRRSCVRSVHILHSRYLVVS